MDPMKNNNAKPIKRIASRLLKTNRTRNLFAVCAIILTTFMLASVFSIGSSLIHNLQVMQIRTAGTTASIFLKSPKKEQIEQIKSLSQVKSVGMQIAIGSAKGKTPEGKALQIGMGYYDETEWTDHYKPAISHIQGTYPKAENEVMMSQSALKQLGIAKPKLGQTILFPYVTKNGKKTENFILSGWYTNYSNAQIGVALLSEKFCRQHDFTEQKDGRLSISCAPGKSAACLDALESSVKLSKDQSFDSSFDPQAQNIENTIVTVATLLIIALFIVISGYLLIYNVIYISVTKDIRFYGMLKTIGAAPRQIKRLVRSQILRLSLISIPIGLLLAAAASFLIVPYAMTIFTAGQNNQAMPGSVAFNPIYFLASALFVLLTVMISCRKPAKIAGTVSPIEALKYTGISSSGKPRNRASRGGGKLWKMAFHNVFRGKKRSILVFASLFMGTITFLGVNSFIGSMDAEHFLDRYVPNDFEISSTPPIRQKFDQAYLESLSQIDGVTSMETATTLSCSLKLDAKTLEPILKSNYNRYGGQAGSYEDMVAVLKKLERQGKLNFWVTGISDRYVKAYNEKHKEKIDIDAFRQGKIAILGYDDGTSYQNMIGRSMNFYPGKSKTSASVKIGGIFNYDDCEIGSNNSVIVGLMDTIFVSDAFMKKLSSDPIVTNIIINCHQEQEAYVGQKIKELNATLTDPSFEFKSRSGQRKDFISSMMSLRVLGGGISILLIAIGVLNFVNVMITNVYARRQELAVMESIGMTKKQIKSMLTWEGAFYAFITAILISTLGNGLLYLLSKSVTKFADYAVFEYPVLLGALLICTIFLICLAVPPMVFHATSRESVTERLHQIDS